MQADETQKEAEDIAEDNRQLKKQIQRLQAKIDGIARKRKKESMEEKESSKVSTSSSSGKENVTEPDELPLPWTVAQDSYAEDFLVKCSKRLVLEQEAALFYRRRHNWIAVPALILGAIAAGTAFSNWSNSLLCQNASWLWLCVAIISSATTVTNAMNDHIFNFKARAAKHHETYKGISRLIRELSQELSNPPHERRAYRKFMNRIVENYNHFTDEAELIPLKVTHTVNKMLADAERKQYEFEMKQQELVEEQRKLHSKRRSKKSNNEGKEENRFKAIQSQRRSSEYHKKEPIESYGSRNIYRRPSYFPQGDLPTDYVTPANWFHQQSSSTSPTQHAQEHDENVLKGVAARKVGKEEEQEEKGEQDERRVSFLSGKAAKVAKEVTTVAKLVEKERKLEAEVKKKNQYNDPDFTAASSSAGNNSSSLSSSGARRREFYKNAGLPGTTQFDIEMPSFNEQHVAYENTDAFCERRRSIVELDPWRIQSKDKNVPFVSNRTTTMHTIATLLPTRGIFNENLLNFRNISLSQQQMRASSQQVPAANSTVSGNAFGERKRIENKFEDVANVVADILLQNNDSGRKEQREKKEKEKAEEEDDTPTPENINNIAHSSTDRRDSIQLDKYVVKGEKEGGKKDHIVIDIRKEAILEIDGEEEVEKKEKRKRKHNRHSTKTTTKK